ncbi:response regulator transcription factor [Paenibacillus thalictri]|uniref:Response regulator transcription factor n=1 Tax=Paenibacillus thalictri TaxID=2527873 RepID=A0A4Q9DHW4_9BACL|nr:response regulator transcription factor [Paenibacillus thalictri]TBL72656.1 response regulator transcription factor [Paenibacillus thalictri]
MKKILIVEDEPDILMVLRAYLTKAGYTTERAYDGAQALNLFEQWKPSLVLLDIMLPDMDGWSILEYIRQKSSCPVIMLTALGNINNRLSGLNKGADDYICKPFIGEEVVARVQTVLRRMPQIKTENTTIYGSLKINLSSREATLNGSPLQLTPRDLTLLLFLADHPNQIFCREQLIRSVWGMDYDGSDRAVDIAVNRIRQSLANWPAEEGEIVTLRGIGYKLRVNQ